MIPARVRRDVVADELEQPGRNAGKCRRERAQVERPEQEREREPWARRIDQAQPRRVEVCLQHRRDRADRHTNRDKNREAGRRAHATTQRRMRRVCG